MKAIELHEHFKSIGNWVNWNNTCDEFLWGDAEVDVTEIAVCWSSNLKQLKEAQQNGSDILPAAIYFSF